MNVIEDKNTVGKRLAAAGGLTAALLASSCCIAPLGLLTLGVSGAWMSNLTALAPFQNYFMFAAAIFLTAGFWYVYFKPKADCDDDSYCATPQSDRLVKSILWLSTTLITIALGVNLILPPFV